MSSEAQLLNRAVGSTVAQVVVEVLYYEEETEGALAGVVLDLVGSGPLHLSCAGDGGILVAAYGAKAPGQAPGFTKIDCGVPELTGPLSRADYGKVSVTLAIGGHELLIRNDDDELSLIIDGEPLPRDLLTRSNSVGQHE